MTTDTTEKGLESLIVSAMTAPPRDSACVGPAWICGDPQDYTREYAIDLFQLNEFLTSTQPEQSSGLALNEEGPVRNRFLARLSSEIRKRGTIDVLRKGIRHGKMGQAIHPTRRASRPIICGSAF